MAGAHEKFVATLTPDERVLVDMRDELYDGSWDLFLKDLDDRLKGKPYIFKLVNRIQDDMQRIEKLRDYEKKHKVNLASYLRQKEER
ncbi:MAG: hypothetical protein HYY16_08020 [Planctomycetes bacterium]|nr:hypothetical protein [Planctomycetota bacterium]